MTRSEETSADPSLGYGQLALMKAIGSSNIDFFDGLISQLVNVGSPSAKPDARGTNFVLSVVKGIEPRDQVEAMLAAQMAAVHMASMTFARRLAHVETIDQQDLPSGLSTSSRGPSRRRWKPSSVTAQGRAEDDGPARPRRRGRTGDRRQCQRPGRGGRGAEKTEFNPMHSWPMHQALRCHARSKAEREAVSIARRSGA